MKDIVLDYRFAARSKQQSARAVVADCAVGDGHLRSRLRACDHIAGLQFFRQRRCEDHARVLFIQPFNGFHHSLAIGDHAWAVHEFEAFLGQDEVESELLRMNQAHLDFIWRELACDLRVDAVDVGSVVFLIFEQAVRHHNAAGAVDEMSGVGGDADYAAAARRGGYLHVVELDIAAALRDNAHSAAMVDGDPGK